MWSDSSRPTGRLTQQQHAQGFRKQYLFFGSHRLCTYGRPGVERSRGAGGARVRLLLQMLNLCSNMCDQVG